MDEDLSGLVDSILAPHQTEQDEQQTDLAKQAAPRNGGQYDELVDQILDPDWQHKQLAAAREQMKGQGENAVERVAYRSVPFVSSFNSIAADQGYKSARERFDAGQASGQDVDTIANYERRQEAAAGRGFAGKATDTLLGVPAFIGEVAATGGLSAGAKAGVAGWLATKAGQAAITPSMTLKMASERSVAQGGSLLAPQNIIPAATLAAAQNVVAGSLGELFNGVANPAAKFVARAGAGVAEMQSLNIVAGAVDQYLPEAYQTKTKFGALGDFLDGKSGEGLQHLALDAISMAAFSAVHGAPEKAQRLLGKVGEAVERAGKSGASPEAASRAGQKVIESARKEVLPEHPLVKKGVFKTSADAATFDKEAALASTPELKQAILDSYEFDSPAERKAMSDYLDQIHPPETLVSRPGPSQPRPEAQGGPKAPEQASTPPAQSNAKPDRLARVMAATKQAAAPAEKAVKVADLPEGDLKRIGSLASEAIPGAEFTAEGNVLKAVLKDTTLSIEPKPGNVARIDFKHSNPSEVGVRQQLKAGAKGFLRDLKSVLTKLHESGVGVEYKAVDTTRAANFNTERAEIYRRQLEKLGYEQVSGPTAENPGADYVWKPKGAAVAQPARELPEPLKFLEGASQDELTQVAKDFFGVKVKKEMTPAQLTDAIVAAHEKQTAKVQKPEKAGPEAAPEPPKAEPVESRAKPSEEAKPVFIHGELTDRRAEDLVKAQPGGRADFDLWAKRGFQADGSGDGVRDALVAAGVDPKEAADYIRRTSQRMAAGRSFAGEAEQKRQALQAAGIDVGSLSSQQIIAEYDRRVEERAADRKSELEKLTKEQKAEEAAQEAGKLTPNPETGKIDRIGGTYASSDLIPYELEAAIEAANLPPRVVESIKKHLGGMSLREAGEDLGVSYETVRKDVQKALKAAGRSESSAQDILDEILLSYGEKALEKGRTVGEAELANVGESPSRQAEPERSSILDDLEKAESNFVATHEEINGQLQDALRKSPGPEAREALDKALDESRQVAAGQADTGRPQARTGAEAARERLKQLRRNRNASSLDFGAPVSPEERGPGPGEPISVGGIPGIPYTETAERRTAPKERVTALAKEVAQSERKSLGLPELVKAARVANKDVWDAALARVEQDRGLPFRLVDELSKTPREVSLEELAILLEHKVALGNELERATTSFGSLGLNPVGIVESARRANELLSEIDRTQKVIAGVGSEKGRQLAFFKQLAKEDFSLSGMLQKAAAAKGKPLTDQEISEVKKLHERIAELEKTQKSGEGTDQEKQDTRIDLKKGRREFAEVLAKYKDSNLSLPQKVFKAVGGAMDLSRAIMTSGDVSAVGRQGFILALSHPIKAAKALPDMFRALFSERVADRVQDSIERRPNHLVGQKARLYLAERNGHLNAAEEGFASKLIGKVPGLGQFVKGSERAYVTFLNKIRADVFDSMISTLGKNGRVSDAEAAAIANYVNVATGRGGLGQLEGAATVLNRLFFAPRFVASRFQLAAGQPLYGGTAATRKLIATEYVRAAAGLGIVYALAKLADPDTTIESDPRSSDFGKLKIGRVRIDPLAGLAQVATLIGRVSTGETKSTKGKVTSLTSPKYGETSMWDVLTQFVRSKLAPGPSAIVDYITGENTIHQKVGAKEIVQERFTPMAAKDVWEAIKEQGIPKGLATGILATLGLGVQVHTPKVKTSR